MNVGIVSNRNSRGLHIDYLLLEGLLFELGHTVEFVQFDEECRDKKFALAIFLEVTPRHLLDIAPVLWMFVNPEFVHRIDIETIKRRFSKVLCKTHEAERVCKEAFGDLAVYTGFMALDKFNPAIERMDCFLHVAGNSRMKGTQAIVDSFKWKLNGKPLTAPLIIISDWLSQDGLPEYVRVYKDVSDEYLAELQNRCKFHLQPSSTEGWSHTIREAMSVNAVILTTGAPPMDEIQSAHKVPTTGWSTNNLAKVYDISALDIYTAIQELPHLDALGFCEDETREEFLRGNEQFKATFSGLFETPKEKVQVSAPMILDAKPGKYRIAFIGNFSAYESTENHVLQALMHELGHGVLCLQENETSEAQIRRACMDSDLLLWVRTPGWLKVENERMCELLNEIKIKSVSLHLDKFFDIPERQVLIGKHAFWKTTQVWTADGSRQEDFRKLGVSHHWMKPAASAEFAHIGRLKDCFRCDVGFVGAKQYHSEHSFRSQLIDFLSNVYGDRFKLVEGGLRGHELNDFYASCKVVVADCFGGGKTPRYWSDRMVETPMRHGFLLCPQIEGLDIPLATFEPENLEDLHTQIEYWLNHEEERKRIAELCAEHVLRNDTWNHRLTEILASLGF